MEDTKAPTAQPGAKTATAEMNQELAPHTPLQMLSLNRLKELLDRQKNTEKTEPWVKKALAKAVYSVFLDCVSAGVEKEARELIGVTSAKAEA